MIKKTLLIIFVLGLTSVQAQTAKELLNEVSKKVKSYNNIVIGFKYSLNNPAENVSQETRGDVTLQGNKYLLNLMGTEQMYDGKKLHVIVPEDEEINISTQSEEDENSITPSKMLTFYEDGYTYKMDIVQSVNGRKIQYVKLTPIDSKSDLKEILLGVDKQTKHIYKMIQKQNNGTNVTITVSSFKTNQPLSETLFVFDESKYENYYINRLD
ncbi:outer membrane lipoprotein carrier protein LolA [Aquimarina gracilis]|uniref:Outer membrane lipoprotein carrier protein LolA n=1 Tax=Aquimarina gracilis TaxID=874422 RepID=A0ABU5ZW05_9FLAO|nr:outer membrane lipoprotein carrier protein LolA [Aquimarina gracilis]MEB3346061.1 outer membrane lipoprotein carrier protein LolA [Aquimarina gracilis]